MMRTLFLLSKYYSIQVRSKMQYRASVVMEAVSRMAVAFLEFGAVALVLPLFGTLGGWDMGKLAFLYGVVNIAFGVMDMFFGGFSPRSFGRHIRMGTFDQLLLRPVNITLQVLGSNIALRRIGRITSGVVILLISFSLNEILWTGPKIIVLLLAFFSQIAYFGGLLMIGASINFWTVESVEIINIFTYGGTELISYPMHIYPLWLRRFFTYILPAIFLNYYPAIYILGLPDPLNFPWYAHWVAPAAGFAIFAAAYQFWLFGLNHYQSTGS